MKEYHYRIVDEELKNKLRTFGAVHIVGPKGCGKTRTAENIAKSAIYFQSEPDKESLKKTASINPAALLAGEKPRLIDEWKDAPEVWDQIRFECDHNDTTGQFILTGSTSKTVKTSHTGTGRITELKMYPMSLFESGESNGIASLSDLFNNKSDTEGWISSTSVEKLIFAACRGGWPQCMNLTSDKDKLSIAKDYYNQILTVDMNSIDTVRRNPILMKKVLHSYARNISTLAKKKTICGDINIDENISLPTLDNYVEILEKLYVIQDVYGWCPPLRSSAGVRSGPKREFIDPSIAVAALHTSPEKLNLDLKTFGFIFECLCIRDLRVYSSSMGGEISYYHDRYGLESDVVLHLSNGDYALIECKLGGNDIDLGIKHLTEIERLIIENNKNNPNDTIDLPSFKAVLTGGKYGYLSPEGVFVIPIGCLGP